MDGDKEIVIGECVQYMCDSIPDKLDHHCVAPAALRTILSLDIDFTNPQRFLSKKVAILDCLCSVSAVKVAENSRDDCGRQGKEMDTTRQSYFWLTHRLNQPEG